MKNRGGQNNECVEPLFRDNAPEDLRRYQLSKFKEQCIYAFKNSPYYTRKFTEAGLKLKDLENIKTMDDVLKIPISSKKNLPLPRKAKNLSPMENCWQFPLNE